MTGRIPAAQTAQWHRESKITLRQHGVEKKPALIITSEELLSLREKLHLSRTVFAQILAH
ncbi:hypothetical protein [Candidatus Nitrotoga sp. AM1P]|uniref:hypothetical protein n=1 Tax=Candidatus Nitrotoga sp. AM1P TaxID=2559597 RepID=UPI0018E0C3F3|nr:hypothetical protein [Candidatus Nitrotoga sp. AM1P]